MEPKLQHDPHAAHAEHPNRQFDQEESSGRQINLVTGMLLGALVGGLLTLLSSSSRQNTKQSLRGRKIPSLPSLLLLRKIRQVKHHKSSIK